MTAPVWSEAILRAAASWQAFKEGKRLWSAATVATTAPDGYSGTVMVGTRAFRTRVTVHSATHLEVRCSCPENQSTGAVCAHAVALGLAALRTPTPEPAPASPEVPARAAATRADDAPTPAWSIEFPPNWPESLAKGRLSPVLRHVRESAGADLSEDRQVTSWLRAAGGSPEKSPQPLHLSGEQVGEFLIALTGHPRVTARAEPLRLVDQARLPLRSVTLCGDVVHLEPEPDLSLIRCGESVWCHRPGQLARLHPAAGDLPKSLFLISFLEQIESLQQICVIPDDSFVHGLHFTPAPLIVLLHLDGNIQSLRATLAIRYEGPHAPLAPGQPGATGLPRLISPERCLVRDTDGENEAAATLIRAGFQAPSSPAEPWRLSDPEAILRFLTDTLPILQRKWSVTESAPLATVRSGLAIVRPKITIVGSGEDWLDFELAFESSDGKVFSHAEIQRLLRSGKGAAALKTVISSETAELLNPLFEELDLRQESGRFTARKESSALIREIQNYLAKPSESVAGTTESLPAVPATIRATLRPYQHQGFAWLSECLRRSSGALLADDMGLGKTLQAITLIESRAAFVSGPPPLVLVVAPTSLLGNWMAEFARFAPERVVHRLHGPGRDAVREKIGPGSVVLTSFATLPRDLAWHLRQDYDLVVVDEASQMRNPDTDHAKALCKLNARHRLALTGTPLENAVRDLWSIFRFLLPGWLGDRASFRERYEVPLAAAPPAPSVLTRLRLKTAPFLLRRTKSQVAPELPGKLVIDEFCDLSSQQQATYQQLLAEGRKRMQTLDANSGAARMHLLTTLLRLRQACCDLALIGGETARSLPVPQRSAKLERLLELLETALSEGSKILVFSQFRAQLLEIEAQLAARAWGALRLDGQTTKREEVVARFQSADGPPVFLISLKAGGYGLNLTAADTVIHFDPWWNPAVEMQATDRAHRIGQTRPVTVYRLLTRNTVEEKVLRLQSRKRDLATFIDETGEADMPALGDAELRALLD